MAFKYKLKEEPFNVGDVTTKGGVKTTVRDVDPETGAVAWQVEYVPAFDSTFKEFQELRQFLKKLAQKTDDNVIDTLSDDVNKLFNQFRTHLRKNYPDEYKKVAPTNEGINDHIDLVHVYRDGEMFGTGELVKDLGNGKVRVRFDGESEGTFLAKNVKPVKEDEFAGSDPKAGSTIQGTGFDWKRADFDKEEEEVEEMSTSGGAGAYLTPYAFKLPKKKKEKVEENQNPGATLGPGPKAGPDGVKDNYYVKAFKYKLVPSKIKGSGLEVKKLF